MSLCSDCNLVLACAFYNVHRSVNICAHYEGPDGERVPFPATPEDRCKDCKWHDAIVDEEVETHVCRRNPPSHLGEWPIVKPDVDWCSKFKDKNDGV